MSKNPKATPDGLPDRLPAARPLPEAPTVRKSVFLVNQQLGDAGRATQLGLLPPGIDATGLINDPSGIVLSPAAGRLLDGILAIYEATGKDEHGGYRGHFDTTEERRETDAAGNVTRREYTKIPGLYVTESDLLEAYGATPKTNGRYSTRDRNRIKAAIWELGLTRQHISYTRKSGRGRKAKAQTIRITAPLFTVAQVEYTDGPGDSVPDHDPRGNWYKISPVSLVVDAVASFHVRMSATKHKEIAATVADMRGTRAGRKGDYHPAFIDYLLTCNTVEHKISLANLAVKLRLGYLAKQRRYSDIRRAVEEAAEVAYRLDYLLEPMTIAGADKAPICFLRLNPARCTRIKNVKTAAEDGQ